MYGELVFYTRWRIPDPKEWILHLCQLSGAQKAETVWLLHGKWRWLSEESRKEIIHFLESPPGWVRRLKGTTIEIVEDYPPELGSDLPIEKLPEFWQEGRCLWIDLGICPLSHKIYEAVKKFISPEIRDYFIPGHYGMNFTIGYHELGGDGPEGIRHLGIVFLSISFSGIGVAKDWIAFEEQVFELEEVQAVKRELEEVTCPLEQTVLWSI